MSAEPFHLRQWREDRAVAHVAPLVVFQLLILLVNTGKNSPDAPWYVRAPEQWVYPLQTVVCGALLVSWWKQYRFDLPSAGNIGLGVLAGSVGIALWILPCEIFHRFGYDKVSAGWLSYLGVQPRMDGFDPSEAPVPALAIAMRFLRMVVVVALLEEVFWRGFLMRWLVPTHHGMWIVPFGTHHWRALVGSVAGVVLVHQPADYAAAFFWALLLYFLAVRTRSLTTCVVAHGVANLILGIHVMTTGRYGFW